MVHFGTGGFRGVIMDDFTKDNVKRIAEALGVLIQEEHSSKPVCIGYDFRFGSEETAIYLATTLAAHGVPTLLSSSPSPTPTIMHASKSRDNDFGLMVTSSHNPYWFNGVKLFQREGMDAEKGLTDRLESIIGKTPSYRSMDYEDALRKGLITRVDFLSPYLENIASFVKLDHEEKKTKILYDPIHGTGVLTVVPLLQEFGFKDVRVLHPEEDPYFGHMVPNPTEENMNQDVPILLKGNYDLAIGTDSDADRIAILDEQGHYVGANEVLASLYYYLVKYRGEKGDVIKNLATSDLLDALANKLGYSCHEVDVGFKNISAGMKEYDALLGGESSGGLTMRGYLYGKDSTFAALLFLEMMERMGKPVSKIIEETREFVSFYKRSFEAEVSYRDRDSIVEAARRSDPSFTESPSSKQEIGNNFKYRFPSGDWAVLRFSGTEPVIRVFYESDSKSKAEENINRIRRFVEENDR